MALLQLVKAAMRTLICTTLEKATNLLVSVWNKQTNLAKNISNTVDITILYTASDRKKIKRWNANEPSFSKHAARTTEPSVVASTCARGSHDTRFCGSSSMLAKAGFICVSTFYLLSVTCGIQNSNINGIADVFSKIGLFISNRH